MPVVMPYHMVLPFVIAIIRNKPGDVLIGRHPNLQRKPYPGLWDLPGGKLEANELPQECIKREVREELGLRIISLKLVGVFHHSGEKIIKDCTNNTPSLGLCYEVEVAGEVTATEQDDVHFAGPAELKTLKMTPWAEYFLL